MSIVIENTTCLHYSHGGSDKVWAGIIYSDTSDAPKVSCITMWGRRGSGYTHMTDHWDNIALAHKYLGPKIKEKRAKGYVDVPWDRTDIAIKSAFQQKISGPFASLDTSSFENMVAKYTDDEPSKLRLDKFTPIVAEPRPTPHVIVSHVTPTKDIERLLDDPEWGMTEKVNGKRNVVEYHKYGVASYNRNGELLSSTAKAVQELVRLNQSFQIDGERMDGKYANGFVAFDLLQWDGTDCRTMPYMQRIELLEQRMAEANLILSGTPTLAQAFPLVPNLFLLTPAITDKREVFNAIKKSGGEGVIFRKLDAPSVEGNTKYELKYKFMSDIDAFVIGRKDGRAAGSLILGLIRPSDGKIITIGAIRSGFNDSEILALENLVSHGGHPVVTVSFLPIRTVGITLVEPNANYDSLRYDKYWDQCTTDQLIDLLGEDRRQMIEEA